MLRPSNRLPDNVDDDIRRQLQAIKALGPHWTAHRRQLYDAPADQQGNLSRFRGRTVRLIVLRQGNRPFDFRI